MALELAGNEGFYWRATVSALVVALAIGDLWVRRIPRAISVTAGALGLLYWFGWAIWAYPGDWAPLESAVLAGGVGFGVALLLFRLGAIGGGDAKLIPALGFILGWGLWLRAMVAAILCAGALGLLRALLSGRLLELLRNMGTLAVWLPSERRAHPELNVRNSGMIRSPFAVALAVGVLWVLWVV